MNVRNYFYFVLLGNLALCRFHSRHVALRKHILLAVCLVLLFFSPNPLLPLLLEIKAIEEGVFGNRYSASDLK